MSLLAEFLKAGHKHPMFNLGIAVVVSSWIAFSFNYFAVASEVKEMQSDLSDIGTTVRRSSLETRISQMEMEKFQLEKFVSDGEAPDIVYDRLARLRSELGTAKRQLARIN